MTELIVGAHQSDTLQKALRINLDPRWYGTIAESAPARKSLGGSSAPAARPAPWRIISAYDMAVSDAVYGKADRYVSSRLQGMLDIEFQLNLDRLGDERGDSNTFFAFADTVAARSFRRRQRVSRLDGREIPGAAARRGQPDRYACADARLEAPLQQEALGLSASTFCTGRSSNTTSRTC